MIEKLMLCTVFAVSLCAAELLKAPDAPFVKGNNLTPCIVGGVDFAKNNDMEVVRYPGRNLLMNPSFESGLRYFTPRHGRSFPGNLRKALYTGAAHSGKCALNVTWDSGPVCTFGIPVYSRKDYTFSCYLRNRSGAPLTKPYHIICRFPGGERSFWLKRIGEGKNGWMRYAVTFRTESPVLCLMFNPDESILLDDLQLEEGDAATEYAGNRIAMEFVSDSPEKTVIDSAGNRKTALRLYGPAGLSGHCRITDTDFFGRRKLLGDFPFSLDGNGGGTIALPDSSAFTDGVHALKVEIRTATEPVYTDIVRFAKFRYASNRRKNSTIHGVASSARHYRNDHVAKFFPILGFSTLAYNDPNLKGPAVTVEDYVFYRKHGIVDWGSLLFRIPWNTEDVYLNNRKMEENGVSILNMRSYSDSVLKQVETEAAKFAAAYPHVPLWLSPTEPICNWRTLIDRNYTEYAKLQLALTRGIKRGSPSAEHMPMGHYTLYQEGRDQVLAVLAVAKKLDPSVHYKYVDIHTYRPFPELPDMDADLAGFIDGLDRIGYRDIKIKLGEGAYFFPLCVKEYNVAPWATTQAKDIYQSMTTPSYDLGWGERVGAAMTLRTMLMAYKYSTRVVQMVPWLPVQIGEEIPYSWAIANANLSNLLGDSVFRKDIRFAPDCRAYLFDDGHGGAVAAVWKFRESMDRGIQRGVPMTLDFGSVRPEFIDMMGNRFPAAETGKRHTLPLSNFPVFIRVPANEFPALENALMTAAVPDESGKVPVNSGLRLRSRNEALIVIENPISVTKKVEYSVNGGAFRTLLLKGKSAESIPFRLKTPVPFDRFGEIPVSLELRVDGRTYRETLTTRAVAVPYVPKEFDYKTNAGWRRMPSVAIPYYHALKAEQPLKDWKDFNARANFGWNEDALYMRFQVYDDQLVLAKTSLDPARRWEYETIQLYFDAWGDARAKQKQNITGYGEDDFSDELIPENDKKMIVYRRDAPDHQLTGGVTGGLLPRQVVPEIPSVFSYYKNMLRIYRVKFPSRQLMPLQLKEGSSFGMGIMIWDRDAAGPELPAKAVLINTNPALGEPFNRPHLYPQFLLVR